MAIPTLDQVSPSVGHTAGATLVRITGTGFQLPFPAPTGITGKVAKAPPSVRVLFDGIPARTVRVFSSTTLYCTTPRHKPDEWSYVAPNGTSRPASNATPKDVPAGFSVQQTAFGTVTVEVQNLDEDGNVLAGETAELEEAYTYRRPRLDGFGGLLYVLSAFEDVLRTDITPNVSFNPSVDYDSESGMMTGFVGLAALPGIAITEVSIINSGDSRKEKLEVDGGNGLVVVRRPPIKKDVYFTLAMVSTRLNELTSLIELVEHHFATNEGVEVARDPADASKGVVVYPYLTDPNGSQFSGRIGRSDQMVATFSASIQQVLLEAPPGLDFGTFPNAPDWLTHAGTIDVTKKMADYTLRPQKYRP